MGISSSQQERGSWRSSDGRNNESNSSWDSTQHPIFGRQSLTASPAIGEEDPFALSSPPPPPPSSSLIRPRGGLAFNGPAVGIDLGTTNSCVGIWTHGRVEIIPNDHGNFTTPSCVGFTEDGRILVGDSAKDQATGNATNTLFQVKRWIGRRFVDVRAYAASRVRPPYKLVRAPDEYDDDDGGGRGGGCLIEVERRNSENKRFAPEEISALILAKMKGIAEAYLDCSVTNAVVAVPANFTQAQKLATKDAARLAGFDCVRLITEPSAAALAYAVRGGGGGGGATEQPPCSRDSSRAHAPPKTKTTTTSSSWKGMLKHHQPQQQQEEHGDGNGPPRMAMVVDWGGGTFDVSIMRVGGREFRVVAVAGDTQLGGQDIDDLMVIHFADELTRLHGIGLHADPEAMATLRSRCEKMKHTLSFAKSAATTINGPHGIAGVASFKLQMSRAELEELISPIFQRCVDLVHKAIADAAVDRSEIMKVILAGGSMRIPKIQSLLSDLFGPKRLCKVIHPDECVAYGAAVQAALIRGEADVDVIDLAVVEAVPVSIGFSNMEGKFVRVIGRNTRYPTKIVQGDWETTYEGAKSCTLTVFEGEREKADENVMVGSLRMEGLNPGPPGSGTETIPLEISFEIDEDGILTAGLRETVSGKADSKSFGRNWGRLGVDDARSAVRIASKLMDDDLYDLQKAKALWQLTGFIHRVKWRLSLVSDARERARLTEALEDEQAWVENNGEPLHDPSVYNDRQKRLAKSCARYRI